MRPRRIAFAVTAAAALHLAAVALAGLTFAEPPRGTGAAGGAMAVSVTTGIGAGSSSPELVAPDLAAAPLPAPAAAPVVPPRPVAAELAPLEAPPAVVATAEPVPPETVTAVEPEPVEAPVEAVTEPAPMPGQRPETPAPPETVALADVVPEPSVTAAAVTDTSSEAASGTVAGTPGSGGVEAAGSDASVGAEGGIAGEAGPGNGAPPDYIAILLAWLERHKDYPRRARERGVEGTVTIAFVIDRGGRVLAFRIAEGSGSELLDQAAEAMLRAAEPLPSMPPEIVEQQLSFVLPVSFALR